MTRRADRGWRLAAAATAGMSLALFLGGALAALLATPGVRLDPVGVLADPYLRSVVLFTLEQASLSTLLSVAGALPLALALHRTRFAGRGLLLRLFLLPQALPVLVGALAIIAVWGRNGIMSNGLAGLGLPRLDVYGLPGILIAHVFFNLPLATRLMVAALDAVPAESWRLAGQLAFPPATTFRVIEWPAIRRALPGAASLVFMLCATSFTLVLTLGGGPAATTLEVAIYQALRYDFDPGRAVVLALVQVVLTGLVLALLLRLNTAPANGFSLGRRPVRHDGPSLPVRTAAIVILSLGGGFVLSPFAAVVARGLAADLPRLLGEAAVQDAALTSLLVATAAATLALALSTALLLAVYAPRATAGSATAHSRARLLDHAGGLVLVVPPVVIGAGWFLALRQVADVFAAAPVVVVAINAVMAMPFVLRILGPALATSAARHDRLAESLGLYGLARLRHVEWPAVRGPLGLAFAFALALSLGDLGAAALFGSENFTTLPLLLLNRMGSYRTADAAGLALILGVSCLALMLCAERAFAPRENVA
ncbi:thiamine/thiamine pyrophosphate ABC transporter permease [Mangrovibrevibacter kandeliae]|uniref:thiamine/thiamine pyrophosphate ABC transporter permease n=1 Tax=Mangrovibrevibacter kandeliae TaxID=2968473 RepID=UPI00355753AD